MLSIVIETENNSPEHVIKLDHMVQALKRQTVPLEQCEVLFMVKESEQGDTATLTRLLPSARIEVVKEPVGYGQMKMYGAWRSRYPIVAFIDSDCIPEPNWIEHILTQFREAPPEVYVLQGRSQFLDAPAADFFTLHVFGAPWRHDGDTCDWMVLNNFAVRKETFERYPFADLPMRQGVEHLMVTKLLADGKKIRVVPSMRVTHNYSPGLRAWFIRGQSEAFDYADTIGKVQALTTPAEKVRWRTRLHRLCLAYTTWVLKDLQSVGRVRPQFAMAHAGQFAACVAAFVLWAGALVGFVKWRLGGIRPDPAF